MQISSDHHEETLPCIHFFQEQSWEVVQRLVAVIKKKGHENVAGNDHRKAIAKKMMTYWRQEVVGYG